MRQRWHAANSNLSSALTFYPTVVFSRLCCLWWTISDILIVAVGTNYCMQIWARCHFWAASLCRCCQLVVSLLKRHFTVSESVCDENLWLELRNCFRGLMFLSKMWALMRALFLGFGRNTFKWVMYSNGYICKFSCPFRYSAKQNLIIIIIIIITKQILVFISESKNWNHTTFKSICFALPVTQLVSDMGCRM